MYKYCAILYQELERLQILVSWGGGQGARILEPIPQGYQGMTGGPGDEKMGGHGA